MRREPTGRTRIHAPAAVAAAATLVAGVLAASVPPSGADVATVTGGAYGYFTDISLFGGESSTRGPEPSVTLPAEGSAVPVAAAVPSASAVYGPAVIFQSGPITVTTQGTTGPAGSVTSTAHIVGHPDGPGPFLYKEITSTCTADESGAEGSTNIVGGSLESRYDPDTQEPTVTEPVPLTPPANYERTGTIDHVGDSFRIVFNEQVRHADGSLTVNAAHMYLLGPIAVGELVIGQSRCGATAAAVSSGEAAPTTAEATTETTEATTAAATTSAATTTAMPAPTAGTADPEPASTPASTAGTADPEPASTSSSPSPVAASVGPAASASSDPAPSERFSAASMAPLAQAATVSSVIGSAFGYHVNVGLFGGPPNASGPAPTVTLPSAGSATPVTAEDADGAKAQYGPAVIFGGVWPEGVNAAPPSGPITVSTRGTTGANGSVTSTADIVLHSPPKPAAPGGVGPGPLVADEVHATCTANAQGASGSVQFVNGKLETKYDANTQEATVTEPIPVSPSPNLTRTGTIDHVGDSYRIVFNEQVRHDDGSLTVNAAHMYLLGPIAVGEMIVGQVRCGVTASAASNTGNTGGTGNTAAGTGTGTDTGTGSTGTGSTGTGTGTGTSGAGADSGSGSEASGATGGSGADGSTSVAGASTSRAGSQSASGGRSTAANALADTGGETPLALALALLLGALAARRGSRRQPAGGVH